SREASVPDQRADGRGVVVRAGRARNGVVVRADYDRRGVGWSHLHVGDVSTAALEGLQLGGKAVGRKCALDVARRGFQVGVALALCQGEDMPAKPLGEGALLVGKRRQRAGVRLSRHGGEVPKRSAGEERESREDEEKVDRLTRERVSARR